MNVAHVATYVRSPSVARWKKVLGLLAVVYAILPVDLVPDVIPIFGWLDDVGFLTVAFGLIGRDMAKHARAAKEQQAAAPASQQVIDVTADR